MIAVRPAAVMLALVLAAACRREIAKPAAASAATTTVRVAQKQPLAEEWWVPACGNVLPLQVGHDVTPPVVVERVDPKMPRYLHPRRRQGTVIIQIVITDSGAVCAARVVKTLDGPIGAELGASMLEAVQQWKFRPAKLNGQARACVYSIALNTHHMAD